MAPFLCFVYRWEQFKAAKDEAARHPETKAYMDLLYNMIVERLRNSVDAREHCLETRTVTFVELWTIYPPGSGVLYRGHDNNPVYGREPGYCRHLQAFQVVRSSYKTATDGKQLYVLEYKFIGMWQGLAWYRGEVEISQYEGRKEFASLPLIPLDGHEHQGQFITRLGGRGQKFMNLASSSAQPKEYDRGALSRRECGCIGGGIEVEGRIMLGGEKDGLSPGDYKLLQRLQANHDDVFTSSSSSSESSSSQVPPTLTEDQLMYTSPVICPGLSKRRPGWTCWSTAAHVGIKTFVKEYMAAGPHHDQAIHLVGGPCTGKTRTAEAIAEVCQKQLITINADEFLTKPTPSDSKTWRELKSTFRQCVRDFEGLVFFSSDRIQDLQPYFQGRISLQIDLSPLGPGQRERIWTSSVKDSASRAGLRRYDLPKDKMEQLIRIDLNRKQIEKATKRWYSSTGDDGLELEDLISIASEMQKVGRGCRPAHAEIDDDGYASGSGENQRDDLTK
ncbi:hypothetical protein MHUMG1_07880 [Metarhizium humberi]|uniref:DUF7025 domain-containing protein n=1 Tax=Metarhizium humberi TaxID=2596975 RepID=A0A9P8S5R0_9HYPO|nr:hypothetical protein MHUMG1_07880 [Metarhizium humberi]